MTTLYNCKSEIDSDGQTHYRITKFDSDMAVESSYLTDGVACECPAGERPICRHRTMLPRFLARGAVNTFWFHDFDRNGWVSMGNAEEEVEREPSVDLSKPPAGVQVYDLNALGPQGLFDVIADAVGEPRLQPHPRINRRGF